MTSQPIARSGDESSLPYLPQIDTLRAIAVATVMYEHYIQYQYERFFGRADGVPLFFAISGFLITGILLQYRDRVDRGAASAGQAFATFYARRTLRIFPAYYALLFVLFLSGFASREGNFLWHLTYTTNVWITLGGQWDHVVGHFWSLSVEEQFYLAWPWLVLALPRRALPIAIGAGIVIAIGYRVAAFALAAPDTAYTFTLANLDPLLIGALLALAHHGREEKSLAAFRKHGAWTLLLLPALMLSPRSMQDLLAPAFIGVPAAYLIDRCSLGMTGIAGWCFSRPSVLYLGKISYGIYLYHVPVRLYLRDELFDGFGHLAPYVRAACWTITSITIASISWFFFERPINRLKGRFQLGEGPAPAARKTQRQAQ